MDVCCTPRRRLHLLGSQLVGSPSSPSSPFSSSPSSSSSLPPRVAVICTSYFAGSHADVLVSAFCNGCPTDEGVLAPRFQVASMYIDQIHEDDIGRQVG